MTPEVLLRRRQATPTPEPRGAGIAGLPYSAVAGAASRLSILAFVYAGVYSVSYVVMRIVAHPHPDNEPAGHEVADLISAFFVLLSLGVAGVGLSWVCVWITLFPLVLPAPKGKMLLATLASAAVEPAFYAMGLALGYPPVSAPTLFLYLLPVAICVVIATVCRRVLLARFEREAQATAALGSPHTVGLYDFGVSEEGVFYYVMELLRGLDLSTLVGRTDLYALGCVAYWLLTGGLVFPGGNAIQMGLAHANEAPEPPSRRTGMEIPAALGQLVLAGLEKDPGNRPASAADLSAALQGIPMSPVWDERSAARWWRTHLPELAAS